jgi:putative DNA primase/helicase
MTRRGHYVAACITIVLSYFKAGRPDMGLTPMNSFQMWSDSVRSALVWCGEPDPCLTMERVRDNDPETAQLEALIDGMRTIGIDYENAASAAMLYDLSVGKALHEALQPWIYGAKFNANAFARWLNKHKDRRVGNFAIKRRSLDGYVRWYII